MWRSPARKFGISSQQYAFQFKIFRSKRTRIQILQPKMAGLNRIRIMAPFALWCGKSNIQFLKSSANILFSKRNRTYVRCYRSVNIQDNLHKLYMQKNIDQFNQKGEVKFAWYGTS